MLTAWYALLCNKQNHKPKQQYKRTPHKQTMINPLKIATLLLLIAAYSSHIATAKTHVHIINQLEEGRKLTLHCQSADNNLGIVMLGDGHETSWSFSPNLWGTTLFYCKVRWNGSGGWLQFDAYNTDRDRQRCSDCRWMIAKDGFLYGYVPSCGQWKLYPLTKTIPNLKETPILS